MMIVLFTQGSHQTELEPQFAMRDGNYDMFNCDGIHLMCDFHKLLRSSSPSDQTRIGLRVFITVRFERTNCLDHHEN